MTPLVGSFAAAALAMQAASAPPAPAATIYSAEVDAIIHPVSAEYMIGTLEEADRSNATLVVFTLRTPGGLLDSTRDIVSRIIASKTPVVVFVAPSGARAASAGFLITIAADVAAMAPGTHIGAAHPVSGPGSGPANETVAKKAAEDAAAYVRTLAGNRRRNVALAAAAVTESRAFTDDEALAAAPPLIDLRAADFRDLLAQLDGRSIRRFDGRTIVVRTAQASIVHREMTGRQRVLSAIANPNIAYLLLSLGMLGLTIELWSPGAIFPGVVGGVSLLLAFFALQMLPVNYAGLLLIVFGLVLLALEIKVTSYGLLGVGGLVSVVFGSLILIDSPVPEMRLSLRVVLPVALGFSAVGALLVRLGLAAQRQPAATGAAAMIGERGRAVTPIWPPSPGRVATRGEIWQAIAEEPIPDGAPVRVVGIDGLTLTVRRE
jgi:membrane-bound serine protease (ClpP class)